MSAILQEINREPVAKPAVVAEPNLSQQTISGLGWTLGTQVLNQGSRFVISVVLARLLVPADFGLLGMVLVFTGFATMFSDCGFGQSLIQRLEIEERHRSSVFWLSVMIGFVLAAITAGSSPLVARLYGDPRLVPVMELIAISFPLASMSVVQRALLSREMRFRTLGLLEVVNTLIIGVAAIALALSGFGVWSLVWQQILYYVVMAVGMWWALGWRPRLILDLRAVKELFGYSANLTGFSVINYWSRNADNMLVGKYLGSAPLGIYSRAYNLMLLPLSQVTWVVAKVMFPALSKLQNDKQRVKNIYLRTVSIIGLITFPLMLGLLAVTDHFVLALYGAPWAELIPVLRIFCILGMTQAVTSTVGLIFQSQGRTDWMFWWGAFSGLLSIVGIIVGVSMRSLTAIAGCLLLVAFLLLIPNFGLAGKLISMTVREVMQSLASVALCAAVMAGAVWLLGSLLPLAWPHWACLLTQVLFGVVIYTLIIHVLRLAPYLELRTMMIQQMRRTQAASLLPAIP